MMQSKTYYLHWEHNTMPQSQPNAIKNRRKKVNFLRINFGTPQLNEKSVRKQYLT